MLVINLVAPYVSVDGYGHSIEQIIKEMLPRKDVELRISNFFVQFCHEEHLDINVMKELHRVRQLGTDPVSGDVTLNIYPPNHTWINYGNDMVGYTMWETSKLPTSPYRWKDNINKSKLLMVPCTANEKIFRNSGVEIPIEVVPLGIEKSRVDYKERTGDKFVYGFMASNAVGDTRKNYEAVITAYNKVRNKDTELWIKTRSWADPKKIPPYDDCVIYTGSCSKEWLDTQFFDNMHCFVYPTRGEGFGLPPAEAMARGCIALITQATGGDFIKEPYCIPLPSKMVPLSNNGDWDYICGIRAKNIGRWCEPDVNYLAEQMDAVYDDWKHNGWKKGEAMGRQASWYMKENFTFGHTTSRIINILKDLKNGKYN